MDHDSELLRALSQLIVALSLVASFSRTFSSMSVLINQFPQLASIPLVELDNEETVPAAEADLPLGDDTMTWENVFQLGCGLAADRAPVESIAEGCSVIASNWTELLGDEDELIESCVLTPARLIERVRKTGSLENLATELGLEQDETVAWLNRLIAAVAEAERPAYLDGLIPDQTPEGTFRSSAELSRDTDIDDELKDVLEMLEDPIRKRLVHEDIGGAETIGGKADFAKPEVRDVDRRAPPRRAHVTADRHR
jgi:hypothetical protein